MPADTPPLLRGLHQLAFSVRDLPSAVGFWRDVLGLRLLFEAPPGLAFFDVGGVRVMLTRPEGSADPPSNSPLYFAVDDIRAAHAALERRGVVFEEAPRCIATLPEAGGRKREVWLAAFRDGEGNLLALMSEVVSAG
jgi:methylmalonyl-CoA/ethylmalonyl-CoA epimerase